MTFPRVFFFFFWGGGGGGYGPFKNISLISSRLFIKGRQKYVKGVRDKHFFFLCLVMKEICHGVPSITQSGVSYFSLKVGFDISFKLSAVETACMKCQNLFSGKNKKNVYSKYRLLIILPRVLSINT